MRRFYLEQGYADFRVVSAVAELTPDRSGFFITFTLDEGPRYKFGKISLDNRLSNIDNRELLCFIEKREGQTFENYF